MPPSIILEVLKITEAEMELRDLTREAEQARSARTDDEIDVAAEPLEEEQEDLAFRVEDVIDDIKDLDNGEAAFEKEIKMLRAARSCMMEAYELLADSDTAAPTVAAETEAIELLLRSRRAGGGGGGGGGSTPGSGSGGTDAGAALALAGRSIGENESVQLRDVDRSTSATTSKIPAEFQQALDRYFSALEGR